MCQKGNSGPYTGVYISLNSTLNFGWNLRVKCPETWEVFSSFVTSVTSMTFPEEMKMSFSFGKRYPHFLHEHCC